MGTEGGDREEEEGDRRNSRSPPTYSASGVHILVRNDEDDIHLTHCSSEKVPKEN